MDWKIGDYGYFARYGCLTVFRIEKIFDDKITIMLFPLDNSTIDWGKEKIYEGEYRDNLSNRYEYGEYKHQVTRMFFDHIFRDRR